jgi:hypothetical protein
LLLPLDKIIDAVNAIIEAFHRALLAGRTEILLPNRAVAGSQARKEHVAII